MQYKDLSPKFIYAMGIVIMVAGLAFLAFLNNKAILAGEYGLLIILLIFSSAFLLWFGFYINKFIYARIDLKCKTLRYGNFLFDQEIDINKVKLVGRSYFFRKMFILKIGEKKYYVNSIVDDFPNYFLS